jgi:hypothetical protein
MDYPTSIFPIIFFAAPHFGRELALAPQKCQEKHFAETGLFIQT